MKTRHLILLISLTGSLCLSSCGDSDRALQHRAAELCNYIPDHELLPAAKDYMTADFYAALDTMFNLDEWEPLAHEWLYYFVTGNGGSMADFEVKEVHKTDATHALATILVRQMWEDGSFDPETDIEEHLLYMEKQDGSWLMSDFDGRKQDCLNYIANYRREEAVRETVNRYLKDNIAVHYLQGDLSVPVSIIVTVEEDDSLHARVYGDYWVFNYRIAGDTLKTVSGGSHPGCFLLSAENGELSINGFEQVADGARFTSSAKRIFGRHYDIFMNINSNENVREAVRQDQLRIYIRRNNLSVRYYQDYGRPAVEL